jgi:nicotinamide mononucleotide adenylyltransferase
MQREQQIEEARRRRAELQVLIRYDDARRRAGHDYGAGQRTHEIRRLQDELQSLEAQILPVSPDDAAVSPADLVEAYERVGAPKFRRADAEDFRRQTPATKRTLATWQELEKRIQLAAAATTEEKGPILVREYDLNLGGGNVARMEPVRFPETDDLR